MRRAAATRRRQLLLTDHLRTRLKGHPYVVPEPRMQYLDFPRPIVTSSVTMTVLRTLEPGLERLDHTPVSEVQVL